MIETMNATSKMSAIFSGILNGLDEVRSDVNSALNLLYLLNDLEAVHEFLDFHTEEYGSVAGIQTHTLSHECENLLGTLDMLERIRSDVQETSTTDYREFLKHAKAANLALTGILGHDLSETDREQIERCVDDLMGIVGRVLMVREHQTATHSTQSNR